MRHAHQNIVDERREYVSEYRQELRYQGFTEEEIFERTKIPMHYGTLYPMSDLDTPSRRLS